MELEGEGMKIHDVFYKKDDGTLDVVKNVVAPNKTEATFIAARLAKVGLERFKKMVDNVVVVGKRDGGRQHGR